MHSAKADRYRTLAELADEKQADFAPQLSARNDRFARIEAGNASIEQTLKVVE